MIIAAMMIQIVYLPIVSWMEVDFRYKTVIFSYVRCCVVLAFVRLDKKPETIRLFVVNDTSQIPTL